MAQIRHLHKYKRKTERQSWTSEEMMLALRAIKDGKCTYRECEERYNIPKSTLQRRILGGNKIAVDDSKMLGNCVSVLPKVIEDSVYNYAVKMEEMLMGLTQEDVQILTYDLAEKNKIKHPFTNGKAGLSWFFGFRRRYPKLTIRTPENTSQARAKAFNKANIDGFFKLYGELLVRHNFQPNRIYNVDEKGVSTVHNHPPKVVSLKGKKQVGCLSSGERGTNTTLVLSGNAVGTMVPPLFVFPRVKNNPLLLRGAPTGSIQCNEQSGWIHKASFVAWMNHFIAYTCSTTENPTLLVLDGHASHVKSLEVLDIARANGVHIICLPPHTTHRTQPLDVTLMKPISTRLAKEHQVWMRTHPGETLTIYHVAELFNKAYTAACLPETLAHGFEKTGLYPFNPHIFEGQFAAAAVTDVGDVLANAVPSNELCPSSSNSESSGSCVETSNSSFAVPSPASQTISSTEPNVGPTVPSDPQGDSAMASPSSPTVSQVLTSPVSTSNRSVVSTGSGSDVTQSQTPLLAHDISPFPTVDKDKELEKRGKSRAGKAAVITDSPYRNLLVEENYKKRLVDENKILRKSVLELKRLLKSHKIPIPASIPKMKKATKLTKKFSDNETTNSSEKAVKLKKALPTSEVESATATVENTVPSSTKAKEQLPDNLVEISSLTCGQFILVRFSDKQLKCCKFYAGYILDIDEAKPVKDQITTKFMERCDLRKTDTMKFKYPDEDDVSEHPVRDIVMLLDKPIKIGHGKSVRVKSQWKFDDTKLMDFSPVL